MNRRDSALALLAAAAAAGWPLPLHADELPGRKPHVIGLLPDFRPDSSGLKLLSQLLADAGRVEGRDYTFYRSGVYYGGDIPAALDRVMAAGPDLILTTNLGFAIAAHRLTKAIPIVMYISGFPVEGGVADSLARPGRNVTGLTIYAGGEFFGKLVQFLHDAKPGLRRVGAFMSYVPPFHPRAEADIIARGMRDAARELGLDLRVFEIARPEHVDESLAAVVAQGVEALILTSDPVMVPRMADIFRFAIERRLPAIVDAPWRELGPPQPLLAYSADWGELMRQVAPYVNKILWQGARPAELPIQLPARFAFTINLTTAKAIGITLPQHLLLRADRVLD